MADVPSRARGAHGDGARPGRGRGREPPRPQRPPAGADAKSLHAELARSAERDGTSLNAFIVGALSGAVGWRTPGDGTPARRAAGPPAPEPERGLSMVLKANLVALALAIAVAVALLLTAWLG